MIKGLKALHDMNIFHRDLKSANIFLNKDGTAKLGDLNVSKLAKRGLLYTQTGTPYYASPEVWKDKPYNEKSDIWSMGCVFYEMTTLKPPFHAKDMEGLYNKVIRGYYNKIPNHYSKDLSNMINVCLQVSASQRPGCNKLLAFPATVKRMNDNALQSVVDERDPELMKTIVVPKDLHILADTLPGSNYEPLQTKTIDKQAFLKTLAGYKAAKEPKSDKQHIISSSIDLEAQKRNKLQRKKHHQALSQSHDQQKMRSELLKEKRERQYNQRKRNRRRSNRNYLHQEEKRSHHRSINSNSRKRQIYAQRRRERELERKNKYSDYILQQKMLAKYSQVSNQQRENSHKRYKNRIHMLSRKKLNSISPIRRGYHRNLNKYYQHQNNPYSHGSKYQQGKTNLPSLSQAIQVNKIDINQRRDPSPYERKSQQKLKMLKIKEIENAYLMKNKPKRYQRKSLHARHQQKHKYSIKDLKDDSRYSKNQINAIYARNERKSLGGRKLPSLNRQNHHKADSDL